MCTIFLAEDNQNKLCSCKAVYMRYQQENYTSGPFVQIRHGVF